MRTWVRQARIVQTLSHGQTAIIEGQRLLVGVGATGTVRGRDRVRQRPGIHARGLVVHRQHGRVGLAAIACRFLDGLGDTAVQLGARRLQQRLVSRLLHQRVPEPVLQLRIRLHATDQLGSLALGKMIE